MGGGDGGLFAGGGGALILYFGRDIVSFIYVKTNLYFWSGSYSNQPLPRPLLREKNSYHCVLSFNFTLI